MKKIRKRKRTTSWVQKRKTANRQKAKRAFRKEERRREEQARWNRQIFGKKHQPQPEKRLTPPREAVAMKSLMSPVQRLGNSVKNMLMRSAKVAPGE